MVQEGCVTKLLQAWGLDMMRETVVSVHVEANKMTLALTGRSGQVPSRGGGRHQACLS